jgi:8-oxo-dGTP diphosphatase
VSGQRFGDDGAVSADVPSVYAVPRVPVSVGALIFDPAGRLLVLKPSYKKGWTIPGGQMGSNGESPWEACQRETREECGLAVASGRLVCVDFRRPKPSRPGGVRLLFDCGNFTAQQLSTIRLQPDEIDAYRFAELAEAVELLSGPIGRRVAAGVGVGAKQCVYLEDGRAVPAVSS